MHRRRLVAAVAALVAVVLLAGAGVLVAALRPEADDRAETSASPSGAPTRDPSGSPARSAPAPDAVLDYQLGGGYPPSRQVQVVVRDRTERPAAGRYNICYVNAFQTQPGQRRSWPARTLLRDDRGRLVEDPQWPGEYLVDTRTADRRDAAAALVGRWLTGCARDGYRAVELDNLDSWTRSRGLLTRRGNLAYAALLVRTAHAAGLAVGQKNAAEAARQGRALGFDFAIAEECAAYRECDRYTAVYGARVFVVEYPDNGGRAGFRAACRRHGSQLSVTYRDRDLVPRGQPGYVFEHC